MLFVHVCAHCPFSLSQYYVFTRGFISIVHLKLLYASGLFNLKKQAISILRISLVVVWFCNVTPAVEGG